jgi:hypothetical protein
MRIRTSSYLKGKSRDNGGYILHPISHDGVPVIIHHQGNLPGPKMVSLGKVSK